MDTGKFFPTWLFIFFSVLSSFTSPMSGSNNHLAERKQLYFEKKEIFDKYNLENPEKKYLEYSMLSMLSLQKQDFNADDFDLAGGNNPKLVYKKVYADHITSSGTTHRFVTVRLNAKQELGKGKKTAADALGIDLETREIRKIDVFLLDKAESFRLKKMKNFLVPLKGFALSEDGKYLAVGTAGNISIINLDTRQVYLLPSPQKENKHDVVKIEWIGNKIIALYLEKAAIKPLGALIGNGLISFFGGKPKIDRFAAIWNLAGSSLLEEKDPPIQKKESESNIKWDIKKALELTEELGSLVRWEKGPAPDTTKNELKVIISEMNNPSNPVENQASSTVKVQIVKNSNQIKNNEQVQSHLKLLLGEEEGAKNSNRTDTTLPNGYLGERKNKQQVEFTIDNNNPPKLIPGKNAKELRNELDGIVTAYASNVKAYNPYLYYFSERWKRFCKKNKEVEWALRLPKFYNEWEKELKIAKGEQSKKGSKTKDYKDIVKRLLLLKQEIEILENYHKELRRHVRYARRYDAGLHDMLGKLNKFFTAHKKECERILARWKSIDDPEVIEELGEEKIEKLTFMLTQREKDYQHFQYWWNEHGATHVQLLKAIRKIEIELAKEESEKFSQRILELFNDRVFPKERTKFNMIDLLQDTDHNNDDQADALDKYMEKDKNREKWQCHMADHYLFGTKYDDQQDRDYMQKITFRRAGIQLNSLSASQKAILKVDASDYTQQLTKIFSEKNRQNPYVDFAFVPSSRKMVMARETGTISAFDPQRGIEKIVLTPNTNLNGNPITHVTCLPKGSLAIGKKDGTICFLPYFSNVHKLAPRKRTCYGIESPKKEKKKKKITSFQTMDSGELLVLTSGQNGGISIYNLQEEGVREYTEEAFATQSINTYGKEKKAAKTFKRIQNEAVRRIPDKALENLPQAINPWKDVTPNINLRTRFKSSEVSVLNFQPEEGAYTNVSHKKHILIADVRLMKQKPLAKIPPVLVKKSELIDLKQEHKITFEKVESLSINENLDRILTVNSVTYDAPTLTLWEYSKEDGYPYAMRIQDITIPKEEIKGKITKVYWGPNPYNPYKAKPFYLLEEQENEFLLHRYTLKEWADPIVKQTIKLEDEHEERDVKNNKTLIGNEEYYVNHNYAYTFRHYREVKKGERPNHVGINGKKKAMVRRETKIIITKKKNYYEHNIDSDRLTLIQKNRAGKLEEVLYTDELDCYTTQRYDDKTSTFEYCFKGDDISYKRLKLKFKVNFDNKSLELLPQKKTEKRYKQERSFTLANAVEGDKEKFTATIQLDYVQVTHYYRIKRSTEGSFYDDVVAGSQEITKQDKFVWINRKQEGVARRETKITITKNSSSYKYNIDSDRLTLIQKNRAGKWEEVPYTDDLGSYTTRHYYDDKTSTFGCYFKGDDVSYESLQFKVNFDKKSLVLLPEQQTKNRYEQERSFTLANAVEGDKEKFTVTIQLDYVQASYYYPIKRDKRGSFYDLASGSQKIDEELIYVPKDEKKLQSHTLQTKSGEEHLAKQVSHRVMEEGQKKNVLQRSILCVDIKKDEKTPIARLPKTYKEKQDIRFMDNGEYLLIDKKGDPLLHPINENYLQKKSITLELLSLAGRTLLTLLISFGIYMIATLLYENYLKRAPSAKGIKSEEAKPRRERQRRRRRRSRRRFTY